MTRIARYADLTDKLHFNSAIPAVFSHFNLIAFGISGLTVSPNVPSNVKQQVHGPNQT